MVALVAIFFLLVWLAAAVRTGVRQGFVVATIAATAGVVVATELLSLGAWLQLPGVLAFWSGAALAAALWLLRPGERRRCHRRLPGLLRGVRRAWRLGRLEFFGLAIVLGTVLLIALISPPGNWESMANRMMRATMWLQQGSLAAYATPHLGQIGDPPLVSYHIAQLMILGGGDRLANLPEWLALAGCPLVASLLARELNQRPRVQLAAAVVAATLPMALLQGSSTQGNLLAAYWLLCFALLLAQHLRSPARWRVVCCGLAAGFVVLATPVAFLLLPAAVALGLYGGVARRQPGRALTALAAAVAIVLVVNLGHFSRNWLVFGHPVLPTMASTQINERFDLTVLMSNLMGNSLLHWSLPSGAFSKAVQEAATGVVGGVLEDKGATHGRTLGERGLPYRIRESETPNFLHHWLLLISAIGLLAHAVRGRADLPPLLNYLLAAWVASVVTFSAVLQWEYWHSRYHVMLFMLGAPLAAVYLGRVLPGQQAQATRRAGRGQWRLRVASLALLVASLPWLLFNERAALVPIGGTLPATSVFSQSREEAYFNQIGGRDTYANYAALADQIVALQPDEVGLAVGFDWIQTSYPLVALVKERRQDVRFAYYRIDKENPTAAFERRPRPAVFVNSGGSWTWPPFAPWRQRRVWTLPDGTTLLGRRPHPFRVMGPKALGRRWSRQLEARICEAALAPDGAGAFLQDDVLIYVGVRRPNVAGERPAAVELSSGPVVGQPLPAHLWPLGQIRRLRSFPTPIIWERSNDDGSWTVLANDGPPNLFTPRPADVGARLRATMVVDCGGRRWPRTARPSAPVVPATAFAAVRDPVSPPAPAQVVVQAELGSVAARRGDDERVERYELALDYHRVPDLVEHGFVAIRIDPRRTQRGAEAPARLLRLRVSDVAADGRVLWQRSLPIPLPATPADE